MAYCLHLHGRSRVNSIPKSWYVFNKQNGVIFYIDLNRMVFEQGIDLNNAIFTSKKRPLRPSRVSYTIISTKYIFTNNDLEVIT